MKGKKNIWLMEKIMISTKYSQQQAIRPQYLIDPLWGKK